MRFLCHSNINFKCRFLLLYFCFAIFTYGLHAQVKQAVPAWVVSEEFDQNADVSTKQVSNGYYYLLLDEQVNTIDKINFCHYAGQVISEEGLSIASQIEISYDPSYQQAAIHYIHVYRNGTMNDRTTTSVIRVLDEESQRTEGILSGKKTLYCNLADIRRGDIVEYAYSIKGDKSIFGKHYSEKFYFTYNTPVSKIHRKIIVDKNNPASLANSNFNEKPEVQSGKTLEYTWRAYNTDVTTLEQNCPAWYDPYAKVEISSFSSWQEVKKWFVEIFKPGDYPKNLLKETADSIKLSNSSKEKQITAAVDFVQKEIRYSGNVNGIYSHTPHTPDFVLKNRYGDCKDKSLLLVELLKELNVKAWPALVHTDFRHTIESQLYSLYNFNHCITAISYDNYLVYVDPTHNHQAGRFIKRNVGNYGKAMVLDTSSQDFVNVPEPVTKVWAAESFVVNDNGDADLTAIFRYTGTSADYVRGLFAMNTLNVIQDAYLKEYANYCDKIVVADSIKVTDVKDKNEFITEEHYLLKNFWSKNKAKKGKISRSFTPYYLNRRITYAEEAESRQDPLALNHPVWINYEIKVQRPGGWNIPDKVFTLNNGYFYYKYDLATNGDLLKLNYQYTSRKEFVPANQFINYKLQSDQLSENIILSTEQQINKTDKSFNWTMILVILISLACAIVLCIQLSKKNIKYDFEQRYDSIGGWLVLLAIGIIFSPIVLIYQFFNEWSSQLDYDYYSIFFDKESVLYEPLRGYFVISVLVLNVFLLVFSCLVIHQFFRLRNTFRVYYIIYKIYNLVLLIYDLSITYIFFSNESNSIRVSLEEEKGSLLRIIIQCCVWIPYLWISERSKHTFTKGPSEEESAPENVNVVVLEQNSLNSPGLIEPNSSEETN